MLASCCGWWLVVDQISCSQSLVWGPIWQRRHLRCLQWLLNVVATWSLMRVEDFDLLIRNLAQPSIWRRSVMRHYLQMEDLRMDAWWSFWMEQQFFGEVENNKWSLYQLQNVLVEFVNISTAGESIAVVLQELTLMVRKIGWCDSKAALGILENEGGNWRTRHLRFRSAYVRQLVSSGEWLACHVPGSNMIADLGTKAFSWVKIHQLRTALGMQNPPKVSSEVRKEEPSDYSGIARTQLDSVRAQRLLQLLSFLVLIEKAKGEDGSDLPEDEAEIKNWIPLFVYTLFIIGVTIIGKALMNWCFGWLEGMMRSDAAVKNDALDDNLGDTLSSSRDEDQLPLRRPADLPQQDPVPLQVPAEPKGLPVPKPPQRCPQQGARGRRWSRKTWTSGSKRKRGRSFCHQPFWKREVTRRGESPGGFA